MLKHSFTRMTRLASPFPWYSYAVARLFASPLKWTLVLQSVSSVTKMALNSVCQLRKACRRAVGLGGPLEALGHEVTLQTGTLAFQSLVYFASIQGCRATSSDARDGYAILD